MRNISVFFIVYMLLTGTALSAQPIQITGTVTDSGGEPLPGATVVEKNGANNTSTDALGRYTINVPGTATLVFSFIGMKNSEQAVAGRTVIDITLDDETVALDDVMVVAYGTTARERFTGSVAVIKRNTIQRGETSNVSKALEGAAAGVQIASTSGQPGVDAIIRIRGLGSIAAGSAPLLVVDGVPYGGQLSSIVPQDIESFNILKDAAATSMYGARGSNGVVMITTRKSEGKQLRINFEARAGINARSVPAYKVIGNPADYYALTWEAQRNGLVEAGIDAATAGMNASRDLITGVLGYNIYKGVPDTGLIDPVTGKINPAAAGRKWNENWLSDPFKNNLRQEYYLNVSGGGKNTDAYFSAGYVDDKGYIDKSDFRRINVRGKIDQQLGEIFKTGLNVGFTQTNANSPIETTGSSSSNPNLFYFSQVIAPIYPIHKYDLATGQPVMGANGEQEYDFGSNNVEDGAPSNKVRPFAAEKNPLYVLQNDLSHAVRDNLSSRAYVEATLPGGFTFTVNIAYDVFNVNTVSYNNPFSGSGKSTGGTGYRTSQRYEEFNTNQLLNYARIFGKHKINALLGHEVKSDSDLYLSGEKRQYYDPFNPELVNAGTISALTSYTEKYRMESFLSRAEYSYDNKYMLSGSFRRDASSKFYPNRLWGNFWSAGAAWHIKSESFLAGARQLNTLRLRASYGTQGNDAIKGSNLYLDQYKITSDGTYPSPVLNYRGAPDLTWEKSTNLTIGLESRFFSRLTLNVDYFIKETRDMIYDKMLPISMGEPAWMWVNQIDMRNSGWEIEAAADILKTPNVTWTMSANVTTLKNELTKLPADKTDPRGYQSDFWWWKTGGTIYDWYMPLYAGVDEATGKSLWYRNDENGNRQTTDAYANATYYETGKSAFPDFYGGLSTGVTAYGFDLSAHTAFQAGGYAYDSFYATLMQGGYKKGQNWHIDALNRWTPANTHTGVPRLSATDQNVAERSDRFLTDASHLSLKNVTLGYTFPKNLIARAKIRSLRIYVSGDNLWLFSARRGLDPRQFLSGVTREGIYPALRTVTFGVSISF